MYFEKFPDDFVSAIDRGIFRKSQLYDPITSVQSLDILECDIDRGIGI